MAFIPPSSSYQISLKHLKGEYGTGPSGSISFGDLYRNGSLVKDNGSTSTIPTSGAISASNFYNTQNKFFFLLKNVNDFPEIHVYLHHGDNFTDTTKDYNADGDLPTSAYEWTSSDRTYAVSNEKYNIVTYFNYLYGSYNNQRYMQVRPITFRRFGQSFGSYSSSSYYDYYPTDYSTLTSASPLYNTHYTVNPTYYTGTEYRDNAHPVIDSNDNVRVSTGYYAATTTAYNYLFTGIQYSQNAHSSSDVTRYSDAQSDTYGANPTGPCYSSAISADNYYIANWRNTYYTPSYNLKGGSRYSPQTYFFPNDGKHDWVYCVSSVKNAGSVATSSTGCFLVDTEFYLYSFCASSSSLYKSSVQPVVNENMQARVMCWDPTDTYCAVGTSFQGYVPVSGVNATDGYIYFLKKTSTTWTTIWPSPKQTYLGNPSSIAWDSTGTYVAFTYFTYNSSLGGTCVIYKRSGDTFSKLTAFETFGTLGCGFHPPGTYGSSY